MSDASKVTSNHTHRAAVIYVRQSSSAQVEHNRESTERQYALAHRAVALGWPREQVTIIDEDLGLSGSGIAKRAGFARLAADVALAKVGIVLGLEVSRLARNNADWYRLLDLCGMTDTPIGDADGVYHPALFNDRLVLGLKGTMSEAELHILRARLNGGIRNKAARGELRRGLPVGFVWGDDWPGMGTGHACRACFAVAAYAATTCLWLAGVKVFPAGGRLTSLERALPGTRCTKHRWRRARSAGSGNSDPSLSGNLGRSPAVSSGSSRARRGPKRRPERVYRVFQQPLQY